MIERVIESLKNRRNRILNGEINCIPFPFSRFSRDLPGIEKDKYYLVSGSTKAGKSQLSNFLFLYTPILYAYHNPDKVRVKIFYFPLEETPENITLRFMSYLLYTMSDIRVAPIDLKSTNSNKVLSEEVLNLLESEEYQDILKFFEDNVIFLSNRNPTGVWKTMMKYASSTGTVHTKVVDIVNKETGLVEKKEVFDYYEPDDEKEYVICIVDHVSLIETERGYTLRESINKLSEYMMILRNKYHYIPVIIQQQGTETSNLEAYKNGKIRPTMAGLSDSKYTAKDCNVMLGITNPFAFELPEYLGYDVMTLRDNLRVLEIVLNRDGSSNGVVGLYFDGATNYFNELPLPNDKKGMDKVIHYINSTIRVKPKPVLMARGIRKRKFINSLHEWINYHIFAGKN